MKCCVYLEVLKPLSKCQIFLAWTEMLSVIHQGLILVQAADMLRNDPIILDEDEPIHSLHFQNPSMCPLREHGCNSSSWWPTASGVSSPELGINSRHTNDCLQVDVGLRPSWNLKWTSQNQNRTLGTSVHRCVRGDLCVPFLQHEVLICEPSGINRKENSFK